MSYAHLTTRNEGSSTNVRQKIDPPRWLLVLKLLKLLVLKLLNLRCCELAVVGVELSGAG